jgi:F420-non-reducing hydrogenase iron-sulfur subunit
MKYKPKIATFLCNWCAYAGADLAGTLRQKYPSEIIPIKVMCSGRIDLEFILEAFQDNADGVFIGGCHPGDCHYVNGNQRTFVRVKMLKELLKEMGINPERLHLEWISASEGQKFVKAVTDFVDKIKGLHSTEKGEKQ